MKPVRLLLGGEGYLLINIHHLLTDYQALAWTLITDTGIAIILGNVSARFEGITDRKGFF
jgi:hypothetical protein